jgi:hypothetical protein
MKTKNKVKRKILTLTEFVKDTRAKMLHYQCEYDNELNNLAYACDGIKSGKPDDFDWVAYLMNAKHNLCVVSQQLDDAIYNYRKTVDAYEEYVAWQKQ